METPALTRNPHPMVLIAAASVTALSLSGVAALAGWLPVRSETPAAPIAVASQTEAPTATEMQAPTASLKMPANASIVAEPRRQPSAPRTPARTSAKANQDATARNAPGATRVATQPVNDSGIYVESARPAAGEVQQPARPYAQAPTTCDDCGVVESVREIAGKGEGTGLGAIAGGVLGGLLGSQIGGGNGKKVMAVAGAAGGAFAGHEVEKRMRGEAQQEIAVRFEDGRTRTYTETQPTQLREGDRVRLDNGRLVMR